MSEGTHRYRLPNDELSLMTDAELLDYIDEMELKLPSLKGYGRKQYQKEITRVKKMLRTMEE